MKLLRVIIFLMLYAINFNAISFSADSGILDLTNDPLFLFIREWTVLTIYLLLYSSGKFFISFPLSPLFIVCLINLYPSDSMTIDILP